jgi:hypothetical protein
MVHVLEDDDGRSRCTPLRVAAVRRNGVMGELIEEWRREGTMRVRDSYGFDYDGAVLTLYGPTSVGFERGYKMWEGTAGCAELLVVRHADERYASVGGARWYYERSDCERARLLVEASPRSRC